LLAVACKSRWNNLRDQYRRSLKRNKTTSGQAARKYKKYKYEDNMKFLQEFLQERDTITNLTVDLSDSSEEDENTKEILDTQNDTNVVGENSKDTNDEVWKKPSTVKKKQKMMRNYQEPETASSTIMKYLLEKKETTKDSVIDPIDAFLTGIGTTLKTLNPYYLNLAKSKIFNAVQEIEMTQILNKQPSCAQSNDTSTVPITTLSETNVQNLYSNQSSTSISSDSLYTNYSQSPSPQMVTEPQNTTLLPTFGLRNSQDLF